MTTGASTHRRAPSPGRNVSAAGTSRARQLWLPAAAAATGLLLGSGAGPSRAAVAESYVDYAPFGVPDFSQCRGPWSVSGSPAQWTHAGPVALATALWWLDSAAEPGSIAPPSVGDGHALVTAYPRFGPARDDHDVENVGPLVEDLALRSNTNGVRRAEPLRGTRWEDLSSAADAYVASRRAAAVYGVVTTQSPDEAWLADRLASGGAVVLALGVWEDRGPNGWARVGGHYATVAGLDPTGRWLELSDPLADAAAFGGAGTAVPADAAAHGCREAPRAHDDAAFVSHDRYPLAGASGLPGDRRVLSGYFVPETYHDAAAFAGQNPVDALAAFSATWQRGPVVAAIDAALAVIPDSLPIATQTATVSPAPPPRSPTPAASASPVATETGGTAPSATAGSSATETAGPFPTETGRPAATASSPRGTSTQPTGSQTRREAALLPFAARGR